MPKNRQTKRSKSFRTRSSNIPRGITGSSERVISIDGKQLFQFSIAASSAQQQLQLTLPVLGSRFATFANLYQQFRIVGINMVIHPANSAGGVNTSYVICYGKTVTSVPPNSWPTAYQMAASRYHDADETVPLNFNLSRSLLMNNVRNWYDCTPSVSSDPSDYTQGFLSFVLSGPAGSATTTVVEANITVQFRGATNATVL